MYDSQNIEIALSRMYNEQVANKENRTGFYRAIVVNNYDPGNLGRVKIRIPSFHGSNQNQIFYIPDDRLPFAYPASMNAAGNLSGQYMIPLMGSLIWVSFETGTDNFIYFGGVYTAEPTGNRYIYFDRSTNSGKAKQITEDDIPLDYDPNKYVLYKSPKGASITIDDRDRIEKIEIKDSHGNSIDMGPSGVAVKSDNIFSANFPYEHTYYIDSSYVSSDPSFQVLADHIFENEELKINSSPPNGSRLIYLKDGKCIGTGIIISTQGKFINISNNGINEGSSPVDPGVSSYNDLLDLPSLNEVILKGNRDVAENPLTNSQIEEMLK